MLERYVPGFDQAAFLKKFREDHGGISAYNAIKILRKKIPDEPYYQKKIKEAVRKAYPEAYIRKIAQGPYSEGGTADLMVVIRGLYIGLEVKRPVVGSPSKLQLVSQREVRAAGGIYEIVSWPEEALAVIREALENNKRRSKE